MVTIRMSTSFADIRKTLKQTQAATFSIDLPDPKKQGMPTPCGTGFFVSPDGWLVTAAHVVEREIASKEARDDINQGWLMKERRLESPASAMCQHLELKQVDWTNDFALIKVDLEKNLGKAFMKGKDQFPFIEVSKRPLDEGEPVYSFGYPLPFAKAFEVPFGMVGTVEYCPRVTSAIVSSNLERSKMIMSTKDTQVYVLDKALNYGNSGGPIIAMSTGKAHAFCSRFQPMAVQQPAEVKVDYVVIPSLYGIVVSLANPEILQAFNKFGIYYTDE